MKPITAYFDLRPGDALEIHERQIYVFVKSVDVDGLAVLDVQCAYRQGVCTLAEGRFLHLDKVISVFSFGTRNRGKRIHVRLDMKATSPLQIEKTRATRENAGKLSAMLTLEELSERWRIAEDTIYRWATEGKLPHPVRIGDDLLFGMQEIFDLEEWNTEDCREIEIRRQ